LSEEEKIKAAFKEALELYIRRNELYGSAWKEGRPAGVTDNLLWISKRIQIMERALWNLQDELAGCVDVREEIKYTEKKLTDDILDIIVFGAFRYIMHIEGRELL